MDLNKTVISKNIILKEKDFSNDYAYTLLYRLNKKNKIKKIMKGKYTNKNDIFQIASNLFSPSYVSFWTASSFKGFTEQIINEVQVATTKRHKKIVFQEYTLKFVKLNKKHFFGFEKIKYGDDFIFVADNEKLLIDSVIKEKLLGNFDEIKKIIQQSTINQEKMVYYLNKINNKSLNKKIGYLLEEYKQIDLSKKIDYLDKNYVKLSNFLESKKTNKKWKVII